MVPKPADHPARAARSSVVMSGGVVLSESLEMPDAIGMEQKHVAGTEFGALLGQSLLDQVWPKISDSRWFSGRPCASRSRATSASTPGRQCLARPSVRCRARGLPGTMSLRGTPFSVEAVIRVRAMAERVDVRGAVTADTGHRFRHRGT